MGTRLDQPLAPVSILWSFTVEPVSVMSSADYAHYKSQIAKTQRGTAFKHHLSVLNELTKKTDKQDYVDFPIHSKIEQTHSYNNSPLKQRDLINRGEALSIATPSPEHEAAKLEQLNFNDFDNYVSSESHHNYQFMRNALATAKTNHPSVERVYNFLETKLNERGDGAYVKGAPFLTLKLSEIEKVIPGAPTRDTLNFKEHVLWDLVRKAMIGHCDEEIDDVSRVILREFERHYHSYFHNPGEYAKHILGTKQSKNDLPFPEIMFRLRPEMDKLRPDPIRDLVQDPITKANPHQETSRMNFIVSSKSVNNLFKEAKAQDLLAYFNGFISADQKTRLVRRAASQPDHIKVEPPTLINAIKQFTAAGQDDTSAFAETLNDKIEESFQNSLREDARIGPAESKAEIFAAILKKYSVDPKVKITTGGDRFSDLSALSAAVVDIARTTPDTKYTNIAGLFYNSLDHAGEFENARDKMPKLSLHATDGPSLVRAAKQLGLLNPRRVNSSLVA
jgi:hypothetical protein